MRAGGHLQFMFFSGAACLSVSLELAVKPCLSNYFPPKFKLAALSWPTLNINFTSIDLNGNSAQVKLKIFMGKGRLFLPIGKICRRESFVGGGTRCHERETGTWRVCPLTCVFSCVSVGKQRITFISSRRRPCPRDLPVCGSHCRGEAERAPHPHPPQQVRTWQHR